ncbi:permease [Adlercreutzia equolifaciens]|uniref:permease n=1 Tax=Adlercreutzia equolifaciens TaxID=446660 RepID=UPI003AB1BB2E
MLENLFTAENLLSVGGTFLYLFGELFALFIAISFLVALLQIWVSKDRIKRLLTRPHKVENAILGALLGSVTPFCSCSTIPVLVGLFKSGAPFSGAISFLMTSPILNPAIIALLLVFFGPLPTVVYALITFVFAICVGLLLDKLGFSRYVKNVNVSGGCGCEDITWEKLEGTFWQKQWQACKYAVKDAIGLFKGVIGWLLLGAGIGAFIYGFVPTELLENFAGADNLWAIPLAAVIGIPMYIRVETMIPIAGILMDKGVSAGIVIALILGGAGASIPEVSLLNSIFKKQMVVTFVLCIFLVAVGTGFAFTLFSL